MRVRVVDVEGTPDELAQLPELQMLLGRPMSVDPVEETEPGRVGDVRRQLAKQLRDFIAVRAGGRARAEVVQRFVAEVLGWGTTEAEIGTSQTSGDGQGNYLRLYNRGPRYFGAFAYVTPGSAKVNFRLLWKDAEGYATAMKRNVKPGTGYEVVVALASDEAYNDALELAKLALDRVENERN